VQKLFSLYHGNVVLPTQSFATNGLYYVTSKVTSNNTVYIKVVNSNDSTQKVHIVLNGASTVSATGTAIVLSGSSPGATNTLSSPNTVVPVTSSLSGLSSSFSYSFAPYSVTVLALTVV
jgi:alpha-N-arabinofuranosidase